MRIIESISEMQQQSDLWRREGKRIGLVPTMGYLHEGHLTLMRAVRKQVDLVVASIFVNPAQFAPNEDYDQYPRDLERDLQLAREAGVDLIFHPSAEEMYPKGYETYVEVTHTTQPLCGKSRPTFFRGVATVVNKLFNAVKPHVAIFGNKDFQQLLTIRRMVRDLNIDVEVLGHPIVREEDGLAMSSRNAYLTTDQRVSALKLGKALLVAQALVDGGERQGSVILEKVRELIQSDGNLRIDYAELRNAADLGEVDVINGPTLLALAVFVGRARLIDNRVLNSPD
jgi:pantoate--beta-alanine ligase